MAIATKSATMRFTISREKLIEGLAAVTPSTPGKTTLPVLGNLLVETCARGVRLSGTDLDIFVSKEIAADVDGSGSMTVPAKRLLSIAKELPPAPVRITLAGDGQVTIDCGRSSYRLRTLPNEEFPSFPQIDFASASAWTMLAGDLQRLDKRTSFAVSDKESRPIMNGVLVEISEERLRFVASDGHRLAMVDRSTTARDINPLDLIVPPKALDHICRLFDSEDELDVSRGENHLGFRSTTTQVFTRLIEGPYPNYQNVIPKKHTRVAIVDRVALISSIRRLVPITSNQVHRLKMVFEKARLQLSAMTPDVGDGRDELPCRLTEGEAVTMSANASFLLEVLGRLEGDEVLIKSGKVDRAMIFEPATKEEHGSALYLVMPMRTED